MADENEGTPGPPAISDPVAREVMDHARETLRKTRALLNSSRALLDRIRRRGPAVPKGAAPAKPGGRGPVNAA